MHRDGLACSLTTTLVTPLAHTAWPELHTSNAGPVVQAGDDSRCKVTCCPGTALQALAAMHARGVIHRDVKTENFCLGAGSDSGSVYALDFGFARPAFGEYTAAVFAQSCRTSVLPCRTPCTPLVWQTLPCEQHSSTNLVPCSACVALYYCW